MKQNKSTLLLICTLLALPVCAAEKQFRVAFLDGPMDWLLWLGVPAHLGFLGYEEKKNIFYKSKGSSALTHDKLPEFAAELVAWNPDIIVASDVVAARAAVTATENIPIVTMALVDPVQAGLVDSVAVPGRNVTGVLLASHELMGKKFELVRELVPDVKCVGVVFNPDSEQGAIIWRNAQSIAQKQGLELQPLELDIMADAVPALQEAVGAGCGAFVVVEDQTAWQHAPHIDKFAIERGIPVVYPNQEFVEQGGLMSYGPSVLEIRSAVADISHQILKGADPADIPMRQITQYDLILRRNVIENMGIEIPQSILVRANRMIDE